MSFAKLKMKNTLWWSTAVLWACFEMLDHTTDTKQTYWKVLREHVFWSAFKTYPTWHSQRYELSLWTQMCWQSCPFAQKSNPVKKQHHIWLTYTDDTIQSTSIVKNSPLVYEKQTYWDLSFLREHVFWSGFNVYPILHLHMYESPVLKQMCWQSCPWGHVSEPGRKKL